jgi:hypothetical protein
MSDSVSVEMTQAEAGRLERAIEEALVALRRLEEGEESRQQRIERLRAETQVLLEQIRAELL